MNSKPCSMCCDMIRKSGIKTIMYSDETGSIVKIKNKDLDEDFVKSHVSRGQKRIPPELEEYFRKKIRRIKRSIHLT